MAGKWTTFNPPQASFNADIMILLTDGSVLVHNADIGDVSVAKQWLRLTPDMSQSDPNQRYAKGAWSGIINMNNARQFFSLRV